MALYAAIGAEFKKAILSELDALVEERLKRVITQTLKQVAHDYSLNYKDLKTRYCADPSAPAPPAPPPVQPPSVPAPPTPPQVAPVAAVPPPPQVPSAAAVPPESQLPMSKMKKRDLELECERRGLCPDGTISELKERVKHARLLEKPAKKARKPKDPNAPKKERKKSPSPPAASSASGAPATSATPAAPVAPGAPLKAPRPLEIEDDDVDLDDADEFEKEFDEEDDQGETMQSRIRRLLAEHGEELDEDDDFADA